MTFSEFVAIKLDGTSERTIEYKATTSFLTSLVGYGEMSVDDQLRLWVAHMFDRGISVSSRKRYIKKLGSLYREYCSEFNETDSPFDNIKELRDFDCPACVKLLNSELSVIEKIFDIILSDAKRRPELAIFLYLLLNATTDIENAISLTTEGYKPEFPQLADIINTADFHHSRKYVFCLKQSRKRMPQLVKEVMTGIELYLRAKGFRLQERITPETILSLWILEARKTGVRLSDLKRMLDVIPEGFEYLRFVRASDISDDEQLKIKHRVAEVFSPSGRRWYAMKVRRRFDFDNFQKLVKNYLSDFYDEGMLFYPQKRITKRIDKKKVTENIPVIPDIVFFHLQPRHVRKMDAFIRTENIGWIFRNANNSDNDYSIIDSNSMALFQRMIGVFTPDVKIELTPEEPLGIGRNVVITGGIMAGYKGKIYDIRGGSDVRRIYIRLSDKYSIRTEAAVDEFYVKPIDGVKAKEA